MYETYTQIIISVRNAFCDELTDPTKNTSLLCVVSQVYEVDIMLGKS